MDPFMPDSPTGLSPALRAVIRAALRSGIPAAEIIGLAAGSRAGHLPGAVAEYVAEVAGSEVEGPGRGRPGGGVTA